MALAHGRPAGATLIGLPPTTTVHAESAAWANGTAVRLHPALPPGAVRPDRPDGRGLS
jgi:hypothetical protein